MRGRTASTAVNLTIKVEKMLLESCFVHSNQLDWCLRMSSQETYAMLTPFPSTFDCVLYYETYSSHRPHPLCLQGSDCPKAVIPRGWFVILKMTQAGRTSPDLCLR